MSTVVLRTYPDDTSDVLYTYEIIKEENVHGEDEYIVYRSLSPIRYEKCGTYDYFIDAVKGLHASMKNE